MARGRKDYEKAVIAVESEGFQNPHGRILMYDDFEDTPLKWVGSGLGMHSETRQARAAYNGSFGLELDITSTAPPIPHYAIAERLIPIDITKRVLIELFWRANDFANMVDFQVLVHWWDGTDRHEMGIMYNPAAGTWYYTNNAGAVTILPGSYQVLYNGAWNELTMSADFATDEYIMFKSNNIEVNMSGIECWSPADPIGSHAMIRIAAYNDSVNQLIVSVDDVVVRELEV